MKTMNKNETNEFITAIQLHQAQKFEENTKFSHISCRKFL